MKFKKFVIFLFLSISLPGIAQPLNLNDWHQPHLQTAIKFPSYTSVLNCEAKTPFYVFYNLFPYQFKGKAAKRINEWPDTVPQNIQRTCGPYYAKTQDYSNSGFDRGHLAPAADFDSNQFLQNTTFSFANAAPQNKYLNREQWANLEDLERKLAQKYNGITVITGVIHSPNNYIKNRVNVPAYYYKILLWKYNGKIYKLAFLAQNCNSSVRKVNAQLIENLSGMYFGL